MASEGRRLRKDGRWPDGYIGAVRGVKVEARLWRLGGSRYISKHVSCWGQLGGFVACRRLAPWGCHQEERLAQLYHEGDD